MSHVDEGTLHAYLDGELSPAESAALEQHVGFCAACRAALTEARGLRGEADGLILALDVAPLPMGAATATPRWRPRFRTLAWAASILLAVGLGYSIRLSPPALERPSAPLRDEAAPQTALAPAATPPAPITSRVERTPRPVTLASGPARHDAEGVGENAPMQASKAVATPTPAPLAGSVALAEANADQRVAPAALEQSASASGGAGVATTSAPPARSANAQPTYPVVDGVPIDRADLSHRFGPATTAPPRRITMDQAIGRLGGTIRLIDGLQAQRVELLAGVDVSGADPSREVVRIYYEEPDLGLVTLDQQRPGPSFSAQQDRTEYEPQAVVMSAPAMGRRVAPASDQPQLASLTWRSDGTWLSLTSRMSKDRLAQLQARVK